jgi:hypothetical protein
MAWFGDHGADPLGPAGPIPRGATIFGGSDSIQERRGLQAAIMTPDAARAYAPGGPAALWVMFVQAVSTEGVRKTLLNACDFADE